MSYEPNQFRALIDATLRDYPALHSDAAVELLLGTAAVESQFGHYLRQTMGPALGAFQVEPATFDWLQDKYLETIPDLCGREPAELEWDLRLSILVARLRYAAVREPIPWGVGAMARYWKRHYNTPAGKGTPEKFVEAYRRFVAPA